VGSTSGKGRGPMNKYYYDFSVLIGNNTVRLHQTVCAYNLQEASEKFIELWGYMKPFEIQVVKVEKGVKCG
jgi:hypothetical protein